MAAKSKKKAASSKDPFGRVREIGRALSDVEESTSYGTPALKTKGKLFARLKEDGVSLVVLVDLEARDELVAAKPDLLYVTEHYRNYPMMLVRLDVAKKAELKELLVESHALALASAAKKKKR